MASKLAVSWEDLGSAIRVYADIPARKNGLPNTGAMQAAMAALETINPDAFDPPEPVPELVARAALRDLAKIEHVEISADSPPVPVWADPPTLDQEFDLGVPLLDAGLLPDDDEIIFPRACPAGGCGDE